MKQEAGWGATILVAIAAVFGISSFQTKAPLEGSTSKKGTEQVAVSARASKKHFSEGGCAELESRLQNFLMVDPDDVAAPKSCYPDGKGPKTTAEIRERAKDLRFVIATLPDPVYTHFPLLFDRSAEAIQQAAQDEHYVYDSSWLPWDTEEINFTRIDDRDEAEQRKKRQEDQPGIVLFRAQPDPLRPDIRQPFTHGLVVFIVGEEPTGGIHRRQFENAAGWIEALRPAYPAKSADAVQIMGPTFSGSLPSLAKLLNEKSIANTLLPSGKGTLNIFSGNITNDCAVAWFSAVRFDRRDFAVAFHSFQQSDSVATSQYSDYLRAAGVTDLARLAIVSEDETAFGAQHQEPSSSSNQTVKRSPGPCDVDKNLRNATYLYYPRDISALRAAYQSQSIFDRNAANSPSDTARRELQTDLSDTGGRQHDTIRNYSGNQMALSQEAQLQQIISMLRAHQSQYILLRSSNPLDQIFLGRFLRQSYPEARVVIVGADSLLRRETGASGLNGIMTLSSYPLLPWEADWTKSLDQRQVHSHRAFTQDGAEGMYVASRFLLHEPKLKCLQETFLPFNWDDQFELQDYAEPFWAGGTRSRPQRPPTWLSVLGNGGFWPVAAISDVMNANQDPPMEKENKHRIVDVFSAISQSVASTWKSLPHALGFTTSDACKNESDECWLDLPLSMRLCLLGILIWAIFHTFCCAAPSVTVKPSHRAHFVRTMRLSHSVLILIGCLLVSSIPILLAWGFGALSEAGEPLPHRWPYRIILPLIWLISLFALCANIWVDRRFRKTAGQVSTRGLVWNPRGVFELVWEPLTFLALSFAFYWILEVSLEGALNATNRVPTYWRSMNLTTGVSPLVPLMALIIGLYGWIWYSLQGLALLAEDRPRVPKAKDLLIRRPGEVTKDDLLRILSRDWAAKPIEKLCLPFSFEAVIVAGFIFGAVLIVGQHLSGGLPIRSLGSKNYSLLFLLSLTLCISILIANAWQLSHIWLGLRQMLQFLDKLPLRRSFDALRGFS